MKAGFVTNVSSKDYTDLCRGYVNNYLLRTLITIVVSFIVTVINFFIRITFIKLSAFERYKSLTDEKEAIFKKLFLSVFINMSILMLLINADFQSVGFIHYISSNLPVIGQFIFNGRYNDLNRYWYSRVGFSFLILIISTIISGIISMFIWEGIRI